MVLKGRSLLSIDTLSTADIDSILAMASRFKKIVAYRKPVLKRSPEVTPVVAEVFFEPSTRTRLSFQMASLRLGLKVHGMDLHAGSSVKKGESVVETIETIAAMEPDVMVVRSGGGQEIDDCFKKLPFPVINAGAGTAGHPTQALLDLVTLKELRPSLEGLKLLIVGDIRHSRVANSNAQLLPRYGIELAYCAPPAMRPRDPSWRDVRGFDDLNDGLGWCDAVMGLRVQEERHGGADFDADAYRREYQINANRLRRLKSDGVLLHPGPFKAGLDLDVEVLQDPRCAIRHQVTNGVYLRMSVLAQILSLEVSE